MVNILIKLHFYSSSNGNQSGSQYPFSAGLNHDNSSVASDRRNSRGSQIVNEIPITIAVCEIRCVWQVVHDIPETNQPREISPFHLGVQLRIVVALLVM
jgi:hypothetical protein